MDDLLAERSHLAADVANVELGMRNVQLLVARRAITRDHAELVLTECMRELTRLHTRLRHQHLYRSPLTPATIMFYCL